jgi:hypothetical protein
MLERDFKLETFRLTKGLTLNLHEKATGYGIPTASTKPTQAQLLENWERDTQWLQYMLDHHYLVHMSAQDMFDGIHTHR